jgi:hypothetical protein
MVPYVVLWVAGRALRDPWPALGAGSAAIAADLGIRAAVFLWPRGSTAAIALVFSPAYITAIVMPIGAEGRDGCSGGCGAGTRPVASRRSSIAIRASSP